MEPTAVSLPWIDIAKLAFSTGVVAAVINQGVNWIRDWRKDAKITKRDATYLALTVAPVLENFAIDCAMTISGNTTYIETDGEFGRWRIQLPELSSYPNDVDWKSIDPQFASRALSMRNELTISSEKISSAKNLDGDVLGEICNKQFGLRGYRAWQLATEMREKYGLPNIDPKGTTWDLVKTLSGLHDAALKDVRKMHSIS